MEGKIIQLQSAIEERESHIFSLQPYQRQFGTNEAKKGYMDLADGINDWVVNWTDRILDSDKLRRRSIETSVRDPRPVTRFSRCLETGRDLFRLTQLPDMDQEVLVAFILRYLLHWIFSTTLCDITPDIVKDLDILVKSMKQHITPNLDAYATMSWRSQAFLALLAVPKIKQLQNQVVHQLSEDLAKFLGFICQDGEKDVFISSIHKQVVDPAMRLHEQFLTSTRDFYLEIDPRILAGEMFTGELSDLKRLDCVDIAGNNRKFDIDKLNPQPNIEEVRKNLRILCSTRPALMVVEVGQQGKLKEPAIVCREVVQVVWNSEGRRNTLKVDQQPTWLHSIASSAKGVQH
ncbi:hypothetical protein GGR53DRAFT_471635 [Hypoxylon sp. FL1150]|nr:hypothetical protein GGR53DRAFT_471635 [Hypoxylon sp. FL1150]